MAKSMTGFGRGVYEDELRSVTVELRSVNHRYSDITVKMHRRYQYAEDAIKAIVKNVAPRGTIDVFVNVDNIAADDTAVELNAALAKRYYETLQTLKTELPELSGEPTLAMIANFPDVIKSAAAEEDEELLLKALSEAAKEAAADSPYYAIQIFAVSRNISSGSSEFKGLKEIGKFPAGSINKYTTGRYKTEQEAQAALSSVRSKFKDAFVVRIADGKAEKVR